MSATLSAAAIDWLIHGEHGISSEAIFHWLHFGHTDPRWHGNEPLDPSDLGRCIALLDRVPELRPRLHEMAAVSPWWRGLVERWDELEALYREELPTGRAPRTYDLMQSIEAANR